MSFTSNLLLLLLLLLCFSLHACNARRLAAAYHKNFNKRFHISNQNNEEKNAVSLEAESFSSLGPAGAKEDINTQKMKDYSSKAKDEKNAKKPSSGGIEKESLVKVPWRVPHNKRGKKHPCFNLDYSPPKTHPPSHN